MKKKIIMFLILMLPLKVSAGVSDSIVSLQNVPNNIYYYKVYTNGTIANQPASIKTINGKWVFCLESGFPISSLAYNSSPVFSVVNISYTASDIKKMEQYAAFGYNYPGHNTLNYYLATQELIWRVAPKFTTFRWQYGTNNTQVYNVQKEKDEILKLINDYQKKPAYNTDFLGPIGYKYEAFDQNLELNNFKIVNGNAIITDNKLVFKIEEKMAEIKLERLPALKSGSIFYTKAGYQTLADLGITETNNITYNVLGWYEANYKINFIDEETKEPILDTIGIELLDMFKNKVNNIQATTGSIELNEMPEQTFYLRMPANSKNHYAMDELKLVVGPEEYGNINKVIELREIKSDLEVKVSTEQYDFINKNYYFIDSATPIILNNQIVNVPPDNKIKDLKLAEYQVDLIAKEKYRNIDVININLYNNNRIEFREYLKKATLNIISFDSFTRNIIYNVKYKIVDSNNDVIIATADEIKEINLPLGEYTVAQIKSPLGYQLAPSQKINLSDDYMKLDVSFFNDPNIALPQTNENYDLIYLMLIGVGIAIYCYYKFV